MEYKKCETTMGPEIIVIDDFDDAQETMKIKENYKKPKTKKHQKREVKLGKAYNNNIETLYITQKLKVKKTKFSCVININNVCKKKKRCPSSIVRSARNECKREAYYNRIVPICMRNNCFADDLSAMKCCRTVNRREYRVKKSELLVPIKKSGILSPVSIPLTNWNNISYEDVSDNSFSSQDELDTLIKRTKQRENQFVFPMKTYSAPLTSTPIPISEDVASTYSGASLHSTSTLVLPPLETEAYSPTTSPNYMCDVSVPYSPTPDWVKNENMYFKPIRTPYSPTDPTNTPIINEDDNHEDCTTENYVKAGQYSLASPPHIKREVYHENTNHDRHVIDNTENGRDVTTEIDGTNHMIKFKDIKREKECQSEDYLNNGQIFETEMNKNNNILIGTEKIKRENENACDINDNFEVFVKVET